jgi:hypothetical protein
VNPTKATILRGSHSAGIALKREACFGLPSIAGGDGGESNSPSRRIPSRASTSLFSRLFLLDCSPLTDCGRTSRCILSDPYRHQDRCTSTFRRPSPNLRGEVKVDVAALIRQPVRIRVRQLSFCHLIYEGDGTSTCSSGIKPPCRTSRPQEYANTKS